ncbi:MAG: large conductance mechanosensitive channel protein MscL [Nocardioidaceae bacterium]
MLKGFKDFVMRGNLVELAVAFVIAAAFGVVITATVDLLLGIIGKIGGQPDFSGWRPGGLSVGAWITAVIAFIILAAVVYFVVVVPYNHFQQRMARGQEPPPDAPAEDTLLLTEIRDLLARQGGAPSAAINPGTNIT